MYIQIICIVLGCVVLQPLNHVIRLGYDPLHTNPSPHCLLTKYLKMVENISNIVGRQIDLGSHLSNEDLLTLLMNDTNMKVAELWKDVKEELNLDRKHSKEVIKHVIDGFNKKLDTLEKSVIELSSNHSKLIADLELRQKTISSYQEQLIDDISFKAHDLLGRLKDHEMSCNVISTAKKIPQAEPCDDIQSVCAKCGKIFHDVSKLVAHNLNCHEYAHPCELCGYAFTSPDDLQAHLREKHVSSSFSCYLCGELCSSSASLQMHMNNNHQELSYYPETSFQSYSDLNLHTSPDQTYCQAFNYCCPCGESFETESNLQQHVQQRHATNNTEYPSQLPSVSQYLNGTDTVLNCEYCGLVFSRHDLYSSHMQHKHAEPGSASIIHCNECETTFQSMVALNIHLKTYHVNPACVKAPIPVPVSSSSMSDVVASSQELSSCDSCGKNFTSETELSAHTQEEHSFDSVQNNSLHDISDIPQLDGIGDLELSNTSCSSPSFSVEPQTRISNRCAPYTLNKEKQISTLAKNAVLADFTIDITSDYNTNIQCSTGFYEAVPKPVLTTILEGTKISIAGIDVKCTESRAKRDQLGRTDNHVLRFKVDKGGQDTAVLHLHHTQQLVQVQGSASRWFVDAFLRELFTTQAKTKDIVIADLNRIFEAAVKSKVQEHVAGQAPKHCSHCNAKFRTNAKLAMCRNCGGAFHNTKQIKCLHNHVWAGGHQLTSPDDTVALSETVVTSSVQYCLTQSLPTNSRQSITCPTSSSSSNPPTASTSVSQDQQQGSRPQGGGDCSVPVSLATHQPLSQVHQHCNSVLDPTAPQFTSQEHRQQKKQTPSVNKSEVSLLKQELVIAKTKMLQLESENKDLERKSKILADTIKIYENDQTQNLRQKYFGQTTPSLSTMPVSSTSAESNTPMQGSTSDRVINYLLDILQAPSVGSAAVFPTRPLVPTSSSREPTLPAAPATNSQAELASHPQPQQSESLCQSSAETELIADASSVTIDEFMETNEPTPGNSAKGNLNSKELTTQLSLRQ